MTKVFTPINCQQCTKEFRPLSSKQKRCSEKCNKKYHKTMDKLVILQHFYKPKNQKAMKKLMANKQFKITDERIMDYPSPTGKAYIGVGKRPLARVVSGFGFKGVLLQTDNRMFIQCHVCGKWSRSLPKQHLQSHGLTQQEYKKKFGLLVGKALVSDELSYSLEERARQRAPQSRAVLDEKLAKANIAKPRQRFVFTDEHNNRFGLCEKQLGFRLLEYIKNYRMIPNRSGKGEGTLIAKALYRRYDSLNDGFKHYEVPTLYRTGTNVELVAPDGKQLFFNYNRDYNRDNVFDWIMQHTPVLNQPNKFQDE